MHWSTLPIADQIFTHIDCETGAQTTFAVTHLRRLCDARVRLGRDDHVRETPIDRDAARMILKMRGLERFRIRRAYRTKDDDYQPFIYCFMPDRTHLLVDGSHTYVARCMKRHTTAFAYIVPPSVWKCCLVEGLPDTTTEELLASNSGLHPDHYQNSFLYNLLLKGK